jgi:peptidoglycan hydrolase-like amidase
MKNKIRLIGLLLILILVTISTISSVQADEYDDLGKQIEELNKKLEMSRQATTPLESTLSDLEKRIASIRASIENLSNQLTIKEREVAEGEKAFVAKKTILEERIRSLYIQTASNPCYSCGLLLSDSIGHSIRTFGYQKSLINDDKTAITEIVQYINDLEEKRKKLSEERTKLSSLKNQVDTQAEFFRKEIKGAKEYQANLTKEIAVLSARQQAILAAKTGLFSTTVGDVPLSDDPASRPDYNPGFSPAFAGFSFGAPHFKGMSQYGAFGRAKQGQNYEQILRAYYGSGIEIKDHNPDAQINVDGYGSYSLEEYAKRIYEMPGSWGDEGGMEALKAQAIAARSYALARGGSICATESCQVFKPNPKGGKWEEAVNATKGKVVYANGSPFSTWYASTSGGYQESYSANGYSTPSLWDTGSGRSGWTGQAYEKIAGSPWFYKGWYKTRSGTACGRSHPWLTSSEFADIVNAAIILRSGGDTSGLFPPDVQSCFGSSDQPWSKERVKEEADKNGGGVSSVNSISVQYSENGRTGKVIVDGKEFNGDIFYKAFNLRAPGAIHLKSGLFNIEKK